MAIPIPDDVRELLQAPATSTCRPCVPTVRATGSSGQDSRTTTSSCAPPMRSRRRRTCAAIPASLSVPGPVRPSGVGQLCQPCSVARRSSSSGAAAGA